MSSIRASHERHREENKPIKTRDKYLRDAVSLKGTRQNKPIKIKVSTCCQQKNAWEQDRYPQLVSQQNCKASCIKNCVEKWRETRHLNYLKLETCCAMRYHLHKLGTHVKGEPDRSLQNSWRLKSSISLKKLLPRDPKKSFPKKGNPGRFARTIIRKSGWALIAFSGNVVASPPAE